MSTKCLWFVIVMFGVAWAQSEPSLDDALQSLPPELQGKVDENQIQGLRNKSVEVFHEKCEKNGGPGAFAKAEQALKDFRKCLETLVNTEQLQKEIEDAKPNGQVDEVFKKYCTKTPEFKGCFHHLTAETKPCFSSTEKTNLKTVYNVTEQLAEFVCFKEGDRIALFIAEGGQECFQDTQEQLQTCLNNTVGSEYAVNPNNFSMESIPQLSFGAKECKQMSELQTCVVDVLMQCPQPTTANIVESLFKFIRKATPCKEFGEPSEKLNKPGSASGLAVTSITLLMAAVTTLFV